MYIIQIDPNKESYISGYKKLIEAKEKGIEAQFIVPGAILTTDMVPNNYKTMDFSDIVLQTTKKGREKINNEKKNNNISINIEDKEQEPTPKMRTRHSNR